MKSKQVDSRGRIPIGIQFAGRSMTVQVRKDGSVLLVPCVTIPEREQWLFKNKKALELVKTGLEQAARGEFAANPPDLDADAEDWLLFNLRWTVRADEEYQALRKSSRDAERSRRSKKIGKSSKADGLFKQVNGALIKLRSNPRHPGLHTHEFSSLPHPFHRDGKVFEAYAQNKTPGAYRIFWCYGPRADDITIIAITPHP
jgi:hypothetical protein